jgi:DNA-directed RNA polymerase subunit RPC12/RpoP
MGNSISFLCPACQRRLRASLHYAGRECACPGCGKTVVVPLRPTADEPSLLILEDEGDRQPRWPQDRANDGGTRSAKTRWPGDLPHRRGRDL